MLFLREVLKQQAKQFGFNFAGVIPARSVQTLAAYYRWIEAGMHGEMGYMARPDRQARRQDLNHILSDVRSMVVVGLNYHNTVESPETLTDPARGRKATYAWGSDYHEVMLPRLKALAEWMDQESGQVASFRAYVDTGAILERAHAHEAGLGFIGKNTMLIHPRRGSSHFLGEILTTLGFDAYDEPGKLPECGRCQRCLVACPTGAFTQPYQLDARRCISYLTIEHKGWIDRELRPLIGNWVFGCDVCQDVCPWQRFSKPAGESGFSPRQIQHAAPELLELLVLDETAFKQRFQGSPIYRIKRERLVRNACIAAGNWGDQAVIPILTNLLDDPYPIIRGHAAWALMQIMGHRAHSLLMTRYRVEDNEQVRQEIDQSLSS